MSFGPAFTEPGGHTQCHMDDCVFFFFLWGGLDRVGVVDVPVEQCLPLDGTEEGGWGLERDGSGLRLVARRESVGTGEEHALSEVGAVGMSRYAEVADHGIGFPAAEELDDVGVHTSTEEGSGPARSETAGG